MKRLMLIILRSIVFALLFAFCSCTGADQHAGSHNSYNYGRFTYETYRMPKEYGSTARREIFIVTDNETGRMYIGMYGISLIEIENKQ